MGRKPAESTLTFSGHFGIERWHRSCKRVVRRAMRLEDTMKNLFLMLCLALSLGTAAVGCADEVNAETDDINTDTDDGADEGAAGMGEPDTDDVDSCAASCNDDACVAACED